MAYFDLDEILATSQKVTCKADENFSEEILTLLGQGRTHDSSEHRRRQKETKVEIPFWLLEALMAKNSQFATIELPRSYKSAFRQVLEADPVTVDMNRIGPYFYLFGCKLASLSPPERAQLATSLVQTFMGRVSWVMSRAQHSKNDQRPNTLDKFECRLYDVSVASEADFSNWMENGRSAEVGRRSGSKRKFSQMTH
uniref:DNA replication complex GINS protein PSF3 n=1 Tax=Plectus sambesii TaxID=2011161 RepID=A0A914X374_9BILA